jgi:6-phosphogluconolactonase
MSSVEAFDDKQQLAQAAAKTAVDALKTAIAANGQATWVLAGGSTPLAAYQIIARDYQEAIDWSKVTLLIGDERIGPLDGPDNNWNAIEQTLTSLPTQKLRPRSDQSAEQAAVDYEQQLDNIPKLSNGLPRFDLVWLGVGEDGHTLSLFPAHASLLPSASLIIPVHDSPKPPAERISLSLRALQGTQVAMILASGADKHTAVSSALAGNHSPIALAVSIIETHDGKVTWFVDKAATTD